MKKISMVCLAGVLIFSACTNDSSSTVGSYENPEESKSPETKEGHEKEEHGMHEPVKTDTTKSVMEDTSKTTMH